MLPYIIFGICIVRQIQTADKPTWRHSYLMRTLPYLRCNNKATVVTRIRTNNYTKLSLSFMGPCIANIFQYISNKMQLYTLYLYLETALHVSGGTSTHHQERIQLYLQHLVFITPLLLPAATAAGSSNGVTNTRCCRYSWVRSWWWVEVTPETCRAVSRYK